MAKKKSKKPGDERFTDAVPFDVLRPGTGSEDFKDGWEQAAYGRPRINGMPEDWYKGYQACLNLQRNNPNGISLG